MTEKELISALGALEERAKIATRKVEFSSALYRLQRKVEQQQEVIEDLQNRITQLEDGRK